MKIVRGFMRVWPHDEPPQDKDEREVMDAWCERMDALLCAAPIDLMDFLCDAILALAVRSKNGDLEEMVEIVRQAMLTEGVDAAMENVRQRWLDVQSALSERSGADEGTIIAKLSEMSRKAPWE